MYINVSDQDVYYIFFDTKVVITYVNVHVLQDDSTVQLGMKLIHTIYTLIVRVNTV